MKYVLGYNPSIDGLRTIAVLLVMLHHGHTPGFAWGYAGVDIFFVISGYLITATMMREHDRTGTVSIFQFYKRRIFRLLPALLLVSIAVLLFVGIYFKSWRTGIYEAIIALTYTANWTRAFGYNMPIWLGHTWSLAVEEQFYIVWPAAFLLLMRIDQRWRVTGTVALIIILAVIRLILEQTGASAMRLYNGADARADQFLIGCLLAFVLNDDLKSKIQKVSFLWPLALGTFVWVVAVHSWADPFLFRGGFTMIALCAAFVLAVLVNSPKSDITRILSNPVLVWLGKRSYGIYLWHGPIGHAMNQNAWYFWPLYLVLPVLAAEISYQFVELYFLERRYGRKGETEVAPSAQPAALKA